MIFLTLSSVSLVGFLYGVGVLRYTRLRHRLWPLHRMFAFVFGLISVVGVLGPWLDTWADARFMPHMAQHLLITDVCVPLILFGAPLLLAFATLPPPLARWLVRVMRSRVVTALCSPICTWTLFMTTLWIAHFSPFFEYALDHELVHIAEHLLFFTTATLFWLPILAIGPTPWSNSPLLYPMRMLYLFLAMPVEAVLGFALYSARRPLYHHYAQAGLVDQQNAGELMWIGGTLVMFIAFMFVGREWARQER